MLSTVLYRQSNTITYNAFYLNVGFLLLLHHSSEAALVAVGIDTYLPISESEVLRARKFPWHIVKISG